MDVLDARKALKVLSFDQTTVTSGRCFDIVSPPCFRRSVEARGCGLWNYLCRLRDTMSVLVGFHKHGFVGKNA